MAIQLNTIGLVVRDMRASLAFYRTLGLAIPAGQEDESNVEVEIAGGLTIGFLTEEMARQADPRFVDPVGQRINLQFSCDSAAEVDAVYATLVAAGYASYNEPWDAFWGQRFARILDPDGNIVNLFA